MEPADKNLGRGLIIAFLVLGEVLTIREMAGSLFIFVSIVFAVYPRP